MAWIYLILGGLLECGWAIGLKYTHGFTRLVPSVFTIGAIAGSMWLLAIAARTLPIGTAYPVWVGIGAVGSVLLGAFVLGEPIDLRRGAFLVLIVLGIIGLKITTSASS